MDLLWLAIRPAEPPSPPDLARLACWAGHFTPRVIIADDGLLLEIGGCLRLFGSFVMLRQQVAQGLAEQGIAAGIAVAATPQAALWLAEGGRSGDGDDLDALPIDAITWPTGVREKLLHFGLRRLGELRRLPSAALARRIGKPAAMMLARAYGEAVDLRPDFVFPLRFEQTIELPVPVDTASALLFAARRLSAALAGWLTARQAGLRVWRLDLLHRQGATPLPLRFAEVTRDAGRFERVLRERLERCSLVAPVEALRLVAGEIEPLAGSSGSLFDDGLASESMPVLIERLRARLGDERVFGIAPLAEHRPEGATRLVFPGGGSYAGPARPFWLLARPQLLAEIGGRPHRHGGLTLLAGPERVESGWWDSEEGIGDLRRDYFIAQTTDGRWAWVFREIKAPGGWFLHGWFG
jgi:protein ImuB